MAQKVKLTMRIFGKEYTLVGTQSEEYIHKVGSYVDKKMHEVARLNDRMSTQMIAVLTAVNIADDFMTNKIYTEELEKEKQKALEELEKVNGELLQAKAELKSLHERNIELQRALMSNGKEVVEGSVAELPPDVYNNGASDKVYNLEKRSRTNRN